MVYQGQAATGAAAEQHSTQQNDLVVEPYSPGHPYIYSTKECAYIETPLTPLSPLTPPSPPPSYSPAPQHQRDVYPWNCNYIDTPPSLPPPLLPYSPPQHCRDAFDPKPRSLTRQPICIASQAALFTPPPTPTNTLHRYFPADIKGISSCTPTAARDDIASIWEAPLRFGPDDLLHLSHDDPLFKELNEYLPMFMTDKTS